MHNGHSRFLTQNYSDSKRLTHIGQLNVTKHKRGGIEACTRLVSKHKVDSFMDIRISIYDVLSLK